MSGFVDYKRSNLQDTQSKISDSSKTSMAGGSATSPLFQMQAAPSTSEDNVNAGGASQAELYRLLKTYMTNKQGGDQHTNYGVMNPSMMKMQPGMQPSTKIVLPAGEEKRVQ